MTRPDIDFVTRRPSAGDIQDITKSIYQLSLYPIRRLYTEVKTVAVDYAMVPEGEKLILIDGATKTVTLPNAASADFTVYTVKLIAAGTTATVDTDGGTIDGAASVALSAQWKSVSVVSDGTNWYRIDQA